MGYRIKTVSELTGIPKNTLVAWERRYGVVTPDRAPNGYRVYNDREVALLVRLKNALDEGLRISEAVEVVARSWDEGTEAIPTSSSFGELTAELSDALVSFDRSRAEQAMRRVMGTPFASIVDEVLLPLAERIAHRFGGGDITVAQEHHVTAFIRDQLIAMLLSVGCGPEQGTHVGCSTIAGDHDELVALALSVRLALAGCRVTYLGADLSAPDLASFAREASPAYLCVTVTGVVGKAALLAFTEALRGDLDDAVRLCIAGPGLPARGLPEVEGVQLVRDWHGVELLAS